MPPQSGDYLIITLLASRPSHPADSSAADQRARVLPPRRRLNFPAARATPTGRSNGGQPVLLACDTVLSSERRCPEVDMAKRLYFSARPVIQFLILGPFGPPKIY